MGASGVRLVIGEGGSKQQPVKLVEDLSRGVLLGRDSFSTGLIRPQTADAALTALEGFRKVLDGYAIEKIRAVATSAVREARNGDLFLDRVKRRTGISFEIINEAEESRLVYLAVKNTLSTHGAFKGAWALVADVSGGSTDLTLLRRGRPNRSGVYALGAIRMRQQLSLKRLTPELRASILKRYIEHVIDEIRVEMPLKRVTHMIAAGGDVRFVASQILDRDFSAGYLELSRDAFITFCDSVELQDEEILAERFRLPSASIETLVPSLMVYRTFLEEMDLKTMIVCDATLRSGAILDLAHPRGRMGADDFERQVVASADAVGLKYRYDRPHAQHVAKLAVRLFDQLQDEHQLSGRDRLLLEVAALLHDIGIFISLRAHHRHSLYLLSSSQIFGLTDNETQMVANIARYHRRGLPQKSHLQYVALDQQDRLIVNKLASILRVANGLDAEHVQKVRDVVLSRDDGAWVADLQASGDTTLERIAAGARADMFMETFGRQFILREHGAGTA